MPEMKNLTINGKTYEVVDEVARKAASAAAEGEKLYGQWMEKQVAPGISVKTGELVNLVDDIVTRKIGAKPFAGAYTIDENAGTSGRFLCQLDENHVFGVYGSSLDTWVMEIGEDGSITQINSGWINASYSYSVLGAVRLNRNYVFVLQGSSATYYASLIHVDDNYQCSLVTRTSFSSGSGYTGSSMYAMAAGSENEVYVIYSLSAGRPTTKFNLAKFNISFSDSKITRGTIYDFSTIVPEGNYLYHSFDLYGVGGGKCLVAMRKDLDSSYTSDPYNDQVLLLFDMSGSTPVLIKSEDVFSSSSEVIYPALEMSTTQISEKEILGIYAPTKNEDGTYNYKVFKCTVNGNDFALSVHDSLVTADKILFGHYIKDKKLMMPTISTRSDYERYPICYFDDETFELYVYKTDLSEIYANTLEQSNTNKWDVYTNWLPNNKLLRVYYKNESWSAVHIDAQVMDFDFTAFEYLAVSNAEAGEIVRLGINGNFNIPDAVTGDSYALADRVRANAYMNGVMSFLPEPYEIATGSYVGTGAYTYVNSNYNYDPVVLNFDFVPKAIMITNSSSTATNKYPLCAIVTPYGGICFEAESYSKLTYYPIRASVSGTSISVEFPLGYMSIQQTTTSSSNRANPLNAKDYIYDYIAWGTKE